MEFGTYTIKRKHFYSKIRKSFHNPTQGCDINDKEKNISSIENYFCINSNSTFPANIAK